MKRRPRLVGFLWRWHRRIGLVASLFVLMLAVTGILLNHSPALGLDQRFVGLDWLYRYYGDHSADLPAFKAGEHWVYVDNRGTAYLDAQEVADCSGGLVGALIADDVIYAGCAEALLLISERGELIESITPSSGLPAPLSGIGLIESRVVLQAREAWWLADVDRMSFDTPAPGGSLIRQGAAGRLPQEIRSAIPEQGRWLTWERLLLDIHSGRVVGPVGVVIVDLVAVIFCGLALSGVAMWYLHHRRRKNAP